MHLGRRCHRAWRDDHCYQVIHKRHFMPRSEDEVRSKLKELEEDCHEPFDAAYAFEWQAVMDACKWFLGEHNWCPDGRRRRWVYKRRRKVKEDDT